MTVIPEPDTETETHELQIRLNKLLQLKVVDLKAHVGTEQNHEIRKEIEAEILGTELARITVLRSKFDDCLTEQELCERTSDHVLLYSKKGLDKFLTMGCKSHDLHRKALIVKALQQASNDIKAFVENEKHLPAGWLEQDLPQEVVQINKSNEPDYVSKCKAEIVHHINRTKKALKWHVNFRFSDAVASADVIYQEQRQVAEDIEKDALETFKELSDSMKAFTTKGYIQKLGNAIMDEVQNSKDIPPEHKQTYSKKLTFYFVNCCKFLVYQVDPTSRTVEGNPSRDEAITQYIRNRNIKFVQMLVTVTAIATLIHFLL